MEHLSPEIRAKVAALFERRAGHPLTPLFALYRDRVLSDPTLDADTTRSTPYLRIYDTKSSWPKAPGLRFSPAVANLGGDIDIDLEPADFADLAEYVSYKADGRREDGKDDVTREIHRACVDLKRHPTTVAVLVAVELTRRAYEKNRAR